MKRALLVCAALLAGCASGPAEIHAVPEATLTGTMRVGVTTRDQAAAALAPDRKVVFDSGYEAWLYHYAAPGGPGEFVALFGPDGVLRKTRLRPPTPATATAR